MGTVSSEIQIKIRAACVDIVNKSPGICFKDIYSKVGELLGVVTYLQAKAAIQNLIRHEVISNVTGQYYPSECVVGAEEINQICVPAASCKSIKISTKPDHKIDPMMWCVFTLTQSKNVIGCRYE
jgi:hypothetical protein